MKHKFLVLCPLVAISLAACSLGKPHNISEYILDRSLNFNEEKGDFKILQITDVHLGDKDNQDLHFAFMDKTIELANKERKVDFIVVTGDVFTFAGKATAQRFFNWMESKQIPWTITWGNHDEQCYFSVDWMTGYLNELSKTEGSYCYFKDIQNDNIQGNANFAINLNRGGKLFEQFIIMDSNRYDFNPSHGLYYDAFKPNQIEWYKKLVKETAETEGALLNADGKVESIMFYHIPLPEINKLLEDLPKDKDGNPMFGEYDGSKDPIDGFYKEATCPPSYNTGFFDVIKEEKSTHAMFYGHDHNNTFRGVYEGVLFAYGVKATSNIYYDPALVGGQTITIKSDRSLEIERIFHTYAELEGK